MNKIIEIDYDSPSELKRLISKLQSRRKTLLRNLGYNEIKLDSTKYNIDNLLPIIEEMWTTDMSDIYPDIGPKVYYLYAHCNPSHDLRASKDIKQLFLALKFPFLKKQPFYIGKGMGDRYKVLSRNDSHRKVRESIRKLNNDILPIKLLDNLTEGKALELESKLIDILGIISLSNYGMLVNLDEGSNVHIRRSKYVNPMAQKLLVKNNYTVNVNYINQQAFGRI